MEYKYERRKGMGYNAEIREFFEDESGVGVIEVVLILVGILTPYY